MVGNGIQEGLKIMCIFGTRPEAIKFAPIVHEIQRRAAEGLRAVVCVSAQHRHLLDQVLEQFGFALTTTST